jgi:hypothetical protein
MDQDILQVQDAMRRGKLQSYMKSMNTSGLIPYKHRCYLAGTCAEWANDGFDANSTRGRKTYEIEYGTNIMTIAKNNKMTAMVGIVSYDGPDKYDCQDVNNPELRKDRSTGTGKVLILDTTGDVWYWRSTGEIDTITDGCKHFVIASTREWNMVADPTIEQFGDKGVYKMVLQGPACESVAPKEYEPTFGMSFAAFEELQM